MIKKIAAPADVMDLEEVKHKILQYCELLKLYAEISIELKRKSKLSQESTVAYCKVYEPYILDILHQAEEVMKLFAMEKEQRVLPNTSDNTTRQKNQTHTGPRQSVGSSKQRRYRNDKSCQAKSGKL